MSGNKRPCFQDNLKFPSFHQVTQKYKVIVNNISISIKDLLKNSKFFCDFLSLSLDFDYENLECHSRIHKFLILFFVTFHNTINHYDKNYH